MGVLPLPDHYQRAVNPRDGTQARGHIGPPRLENDLER